MKFWLSLVFEPHDQLPDLARMAEDLGFEGVVLPDHVVVLDGDRTPHPGGFPLRTEDAFMDPLSTIAFLAARTSRLRFATYVLVVPLRDPFLLAKQLMTVALLSENRLVLGTGVGWLEEEFRTIGEGWSDRGRRFDEMLTILRDFWEDGYAEHHGCHYDFARSGMFPVPSAPLPIWIGGHSPTAARRAASFDGYIPMRAGVDEQTRREFELIDELREAQGLTAPFDRITAWSGGPDPALLHPLERDGITNVVVMAWPMNDRAVTMQEKRAAAQTFANGLLG